MYAVKIFEKKGMEPYEAMWLKEEVAVLQLVDHPHIVRTHDFIEDYDAYYVVMELVKGGELLNRITAKVSRNLFFILSLRRGGR